MRSGPRGAVRATGTRSGQQWRGAASGTRPSGTLRAMLDHSLTLPAPASLRLSPCLCGSLHAPAACSTPLRPAPAPVTYSVPLRHALRPVAGSCLCGSLRGLFCALAARSVPLWPSSCTCGLLEIDGPLRLVSRSCGPLRSRHWFRDFSGFY